MKSVLFGLALSVILWGTAFASYAPISYNKSREALAAACDHLGDKGEGYGLQSKTGAYGCRDTVNGNAVQCDANGKCHDYSGDPRWKHIQILLKGGNDPARAVMRSAAI
ncbi:hypothetical protein [Aestuariivirga sp.]|uniref:hypothetical protein n=1 Tax=Aestuariivirga sp. TaxID=2650926 RepID=UPI0039E3EC93